MADEVNFVTHLLTYEEALARVWGRERDVLKFAWAIFLRTVDIEAAHAKQAALQESEGEFSEGAA
jgi:hypothetical protein